LNTGKNLSNWDTGIVTTYALYIVLGLITVLFLLFQTFVFNYIDVSYTIRLLLIYIPTLLLIKL
jgi:NADH-ubiquinone oxidoreductase chain 5